MGLIFRDEPIKGGEFELDEDFMDKSSGLSCIGSIMERA